MPRTVPSLILASCVEEKWQAAAVFPWSIAYLAILALLLVLRSNSPIFFLFLESLAGDTEDKTNYNIVLFSHFSLTVSCNGKIAAGNKAFLCGQK